MDTFKNLIFNLIPNDISGDKLSYFGSIISALLGLIGGALVTYITIFFSTRQYRADKFDNTFFNLLNLFTEARDEDTQKYITNFLSQIQIDSKDIKEKYIQQRLNIFIKEKFESENMIYTLNQIPGYSTFKKKLELQDELQCAIENKDHYKSNNLNNEVYKLHQTLIDMYAYLPSICISIKSFEDSPNYQKLSDLEENLKKYDIGIDDISKTNLKKFSKKVKNENTRLKNIRYINPSNQEYENLVIEKMNETGNLFHQSLGSYFRSFYIIIAFIMNNNIRRKQKKEYLRIVRSVLNSNEILAIFYNSFYYSRGKKLGNLLTTRWPRKKVYFFSSKNDCERVNNNIENGNNNDLDLALTYFNFKELYFNMLDFSKLQK